MGDAMTASLNIEMSCNQTPNLKHGLVHARFGKKPSK